MIYLTCSMMHTGDLTHYGLSCAKDWGYLGIVQQIMEISLNNWIMP